jgi:hypothetical protein
MTRKITSLFAKSLTACIFSLLFSGCVIYPEDEGFGGFPQNVREVLLSNGAPFFAGPPEIVSVDLDPDCSDYTSSADLFLLSYTGAVQEDFDDYASYLIAEFGNYDNDASVDNYSCYAWMLNGRVGIELGFSNQPVMSPTADLSVSFVPPYTLYLLIAIF